MNLLQFRDEFGTSFAWIGRKVGLSVQSISAFAHGKTRPSWETAGLIEAVTRGHVKRSQWYAPELVPSTSPSVTDVTPRHAPSRDVTPVT
jgi:DNA-binding XRE family transcriptional regulator